MTTTPSALRLGYMCLFVEDFEKAAHFYEHVLQLPVKERTEDFLGFDAGACVLGLEPRGKGSNEEKSRAQNPYVVQFSLESRAEFTAWGERLREQNVRILLANEELTFGTLTAFLDPEGNRLELLLAPGR
ncbi:MAG: VOC family protein [Polyangiaceae bacterium]|nr:VOC family protein [Polyangiaceae bacterium]